ncbi:MAG: hypothetical protein JNM43_22175 [Planctomycetaceae bacterium]|nr:hypothetical protein [Planctomycetaceae bacterium]
MLLGALLSQAVLVALIDCCIWGTIILELWTGVAVAGSRINMGVVHRSKTPGPYWVAMSIQFLAVGVREYLRWS